MKINKKLSDKLAGIYKDTLKVGTQHVHTENSLDDSTLSVEELCKVVKELGGNVAFITDHGTLMGWDDFNAACQKTGLKPVFGCEEYVAMKIAADYKKFEGKEVLEEDEDFNSKSVIKSHFVVMAKDNIGLRQIQMAMSRGVVLKDGRCCLTDEIIKNTFKGGHVFVTSACISGVLGAMFLYNNRIVERIKDVEADIENMAGAVEKSVESAKKLLELKEQVDFKKSEVKMAKDASKKSFKGREKTLASKKKALEKVQTAFDKYLEADTPANIKSLRSALSALEVDVVDDDEFQEGVENAEAYVNRLAAQIKAEKDEVNVLASSLPKKEAELEEATAKFKEFAAIDDEVQKEASKVTTLLEKKSTLESQRLSNEFLKSYVEERLNFMLDVFGKDFFMEMQYHGMEEEKAIYTYLYKVAKRRGIPLIAANDAHMGRGTQDDIDARQIRRSCRFKTWEDVSESDVEMYIKSDRELAEALYQILPEDAVIEAMENVAKVAEECNATIVKESHAPKAKVKNVKDEIVRLARANIKSKYGNQWSQKHEERFEYEISIIDSMGFSDYFYITADIINIGRKVGSLSYEKLEELKTVMNDMTLDELMAYLDEFGTEINLSIGLGRGSGAGSLICYLLGITNVDPFKFDLLFERFLNPERISMPDIDTDFRPDIRDVILVYLKLVYGERAISQILTKSYLQGKSAIDKVTMLLGSRDTIDREKRFAAGETMKAGETQTVYDRNGVAKTVVAKVDYRYIADALKKKSGVDFDKNSLLENRDALLANATSDIEREIVEKAILMDGNLDHTSLHAAGCIISDNDDLAEYIPVAWDEGSKTWKTQCDMVQAESLHGLLKMDLLILKTLSVITYALRMIEKNHGVKIDVENLPIETAVIKAIYAAGNTKDVFQFESGGMIKFLKQLNPDSIDDIIAANAMYRPGPMDEIPNYIAAKRSGDIKYDCPQLEPILKDTYGIIIYQEQVMRIVRDLAGYSMGRSDLVRRAMSKKHMEELEIERENFIYGNADAGIHGCVALGISPEVANTIFDKMTNFAKYAFNKSHAAAYSLLSYITAWLKFYYPAEFYAAVLNFTDKIDKIPAIIADAKKNGIEVLRPDINKSEANFTTENGAVRFGLSFLRGAKASADPVLALRESGFKTFKSFVAAKPGKALAEAVIYSGACDFFIKTPDGRNNLIKAYPELEKLFKSVMAAQVKLKDSEAKYNEAEKKLAELKEAAIELSRDNQFEEISEVQTIQFAEEEILKAQKELDKLQKTLLNDKNSFDEKAAAWDSYVGEKVPPMTMLERLEKEREYTSVFFSGDPLDNYEIPKNVVEIDNLEADENSWIVGTISNSTELKTRQGALPMMSGQITDYTGTMDFIIFPKVYSAIASNIQTVMALKGKMTLKDNPDDPENPDIQFVVSDAKSLVEKKGKKMLIFFERDEYNKLSSLIKSATITKENGGIPAFLTNGKRDGYKRSEYKAGFITEEFAIANGLKYTIE